MTAAIMAAMIPLHAVAMFVAFTKLANMFDPAKIKAKGRHQQRMKKIFPR